MSLTESTGRQLISLIRCAVSTVVTAVLFGYVAFLGYGGMILLGIVPDSPIVLVLGIAGFFVGAIVGGTALANKSWRLLAGIATLDVVIIVIHIQLVCHGAAMSPLVAPK